MLRVIVLGLVLGLAACASTKPAAPSGFLSSYDGMAPKGGLRHVGTRRVDDAALARVRSVALAPTTFAGPRPRWMSEEQGAQLLRQVDAKLCFAFTRFYDLAPPDRADAVVRAAITDATATGEAASGVSAVSRFFIPGPLGVRPGGGGALSAEAEMIDRPTGRQIAALTWSRATTFIGTDTPSLAEAGDALQFANKFGSRTGKVFRAKGVKRRTIEAETDPCKAFGARFRVDGFLARAVTGLYVPSMSTAKDDEKVATEPKSPKDPR